MIATSNIEKLRLEALSSLEFFTRIMFKHMTGESFILSWHHKEVIKALEAVVDGSVPRLIINMPPRFSKTEIAIKMFVAWCYALNPKCNFMHLSYSDTLVTINSLSIQSIINSELYQELFPNVQIAESRALEGKKQTQKLWYTTSNGYFYASPFMGQTTGFGAGSFIKKKQFGGAMLIDDPLKAADAQSELIRDKYNNTFDNSLNSRLNDPSTPIILIMQRLHANDLTGHILEGNENRVEYKKGDEWDANIDYKWTHLVLPAIIIDEDGTERALWPEKFPLGYIKKIEKRDAYSFSAQYQQNPSDSEGFMYPGGFKVYKKFEEIESLVYCIVDTADDGADMFCAVAYKEDKEKIQVVDVMYTPASMAETENSLPAFLNKNKVSVALIEKNKTPTSFFRNVRFALKNKFRNYYCQVVPYQQQNTKSTRLLYNSPRLQEIVYMPEDWDDRWPLYYTAMTKFPKKPQQKVKDDAPDATTVTVELHGKPKIRRTNFNMTSD